MISDDTTITLDADSVVFTTSTNQGAQVVRVRMGPHPRITPSTVSLEDGKLVYRPLSLTLAEVKEFFTKASQRWARAHHP